MLTFEQQREWGKLFKREIVAWKFDSIIYNFICTSAEAVSVSRFNVSTVFCYTSVLEVRGLLFKKMKI